MSAPRRHRILSFASEPGPGGRHAGLPMLTHPSTARNTVVAGMGEFVGTFLFLFFSFAGTQIANTPAPTVPASGFALPNTSNLIFIALAFGMALMANVWAFYRVTGGLFNPVVCLLPGLLLCAAVLKIMTRDMGRSPSPCFSSAVSALCAPLS